MAFRERTALFLILVIALMTTTAWLGGQTLQMESLGREADSLSDKRVDKKLWGKGSSASDLTERRFPIEAWGKHFSPLGTKRASIDPSETREKRLVEKKRFDRREADEFRKMSQWNERMSELRKRAGIATSAEAELTEDARHYGMMLQDTVRFAEMGDELSLRDLNRYQFRRNRPDEAVPVEAAGSGAN